ncbi:hypothetical protein [Salinicola rhizosphaerae]|uniref:CopG family transcriptional regulator n=1 Tax=Salinicola rhizosphaerae TaxID=1443141 RepID=A0ABQ3ECC7_9GAMM|nr:hypothetical protein [Salinicola rhizosphaerae]GHB33038.1 hypothetical protein GCM10009038_35010 [Salinicola rhizosphaerae]
MPEQTIDIDEPLEQTLEEVRQQQGLSSREQAAEFLLRCRLRKGTQSLTGRGRAIYAVEGETR